MKSYYWSTDSSADLASGPDGYAGTLEDAKRLAANAADALVSGRAEIEEVIDGTQEPRGWSYPYDTEDGWEEI